MKLAREIRAIAAEEIAQAFRTRKLLYMAVVVVLFFLIVHYAQAAQLAMLVLFNPEKVVALPLLIAHLMFFFVVPLLSLLFGFDMVSGEIQNETIRFLASRFSRKSIILGKYLGSLLNISFTVFAALLIGTVYYAALSKDVLVAYPFMLWIFLSCYAAAFLGVVCFVSVFTSRTSVTLYLVFLVFTLFLVAGLRKMPYVSPFSFFNFSLSLSSISYGIFGLVVYGAVWLVASTLLFERRDL
jgi:ABC-2 type transport system permease protein